MTNDELHRIEFTQMRHKKVIGHLKPNVCHNGGFDVWRAPCMIELVAGNSCVVGIIMLMRVISLVMRSTIAKRKSFS